MIHHPFTKTKLCIIKRTFWYICTLSSASRLYGALTRLFINMSPLPNQGIGTNSTDKYFSIVEEQAGQTELSAHAAQQWQKSSLE